MLGNIAKKENDKLEETNKKYGLSLNEQVTYGKM